MGSLSTGGGSSAVAASAHAGCERYRHTDPVITGRSRRQLATVLGRPDTTAGIPEGRWMRAMAFERLVRHERFVSQLLTTAVGRLGLNRPVDVHRADGGVAPDSTAARLEAAHQRAVTNGSATMITGLAIPFVGLEGVEATPVKPDFAIVVPRELDDGSLGSWLIMGDAKDYERVRSRIDDQRMLKGFLQVALGAESAAAWSLLPSGMEVHGWGALAVPRNAFLQPEAIVEQLDDHRREVRARVDERTLLWADLGHQVADEDLAEFVALRVAAFDPVSCSACPMFDYCRTELRASTDPNYLLAEIGIPPELRASVSGLVDGGNAADEASPALVAQVRATLTGRPYWTGLRRIDPIGQPCTINVVLAKSDAAALGIHGIAVQRVRADGSSESWKLHVFDDPQSSPTRAGVMNVLGEELRSALEELGAAPLAAGVHLVVPDRATADVLVSIADSLAGVETSRLRWQRDIEQGRPQLTFNGEPAVLPMPLTDDQRAAVSFLLDADRSRAMSLRCAIVDARQVLAAHVVAGGPTIDSGRLDYLVAWAEAARSLDHRAISDEIRESVSSPGANLTNVGSDAIHRALRGPRDRRGRKGTPDLVLYEKLVRSELTYRCDILTRALAVLAGVQPSNLHAAYLATEVDAQKVWRRRLAFHASDLVRFGRTTTVWRNRQVALLEGDRACSTKLAALSSVDAALEMAVAAGTREVAVAEVVALAPVRVIVRSRRISDGSTAVALHVNDQPCAERSTVTVRIYQGSVKLGHVSVGELVDDGGDGLRWDLVEPLDLQIGDRVIVADADWFNTFPSGHEISVDRPGPDKQNAPKPSCGLDTYESYPDEHRWCCRSHEHSEAEWSDVLAGRRARGELNPQVWPPVVDEDQFDTPAEGSPTDPAVDDDSPVAADLTIDDLE